RARSTAPARSLVALLLVWPAPGHRAAGAEDPDAGRRPPPRRARDRRSPTPLAGSATAADPARRAAGARGDRRPGRPTGHAPTRSELGRDAGRADPAGCAIGGGAMHPSPRRAHRAARMRRPWTLM